MTLCAAERRRRRALDNLLTKSTWRGAARLARAADRRWVSAEAFVDGKARVDEKTGLVVDNWDGLVEGIARELLHL